MKWQYDKLYEQWWSDNWVIQKNGSRYQLMEDREGWLSVQRVVCSFRKLSTAKQVAELIETG